MADPTDLLWRGVSPSGTRVVATEPVGRSSLALLDRIDDLAPNVTRAELHDPGEGWHVDDDAVVLGLAPPGAPAADGLHHRLAAALDRYAMAEPAIVRGCWRAGAPLDGRRMVLEGRFGPLRFPMPVVVDHVVQGRRQVGGRAVDVAAWSYTTLEGHLERGRMDWGIWSWPDTGQVELRVHSRSSRAALPNPVIGLGMAVFGRLVQRTFVRRAAVRLRAIADADPAVADLVPASGGVLGPLDVVTAG